MLKTLNDITEAKLIEAIEEIVAEIGDEDAIDPATITTAEAAEAFDKPHSKMLVIMRGLAKEGVVEPSYIRRHNGWHFTSVKGWRLIKREEKEVNENFNGHGSH